MEPTFDYKDLLVKYIAEVCYKEGSLCITGYFLTEAEEAEIERLCEGARPLKPRAMHEPRTQK